MLQKIIVGLVITSLISCVGQDKLTRLIEYPQQFQNKKVTVNGFLHLDSIDNVIYVTKIDFEQKITRNGFLLSFNDSVAFDKNQLNHKYVQIDGVFDQSVQSTNKAFSGQIKNITRVEGKGND